MEQSTAEPSHSPAPSLFLEPTLNTYYYVQRPDESWHVAEVIQKREVDVENEKKKEFYIHYKDCKMACFTVAKWVYTMHCVLSQPQNGRVGPLESH